MIEHTSAALYAVTLICNISNNSLWDCLGVVSIQYNQIYESDISISQLTAKLGLQFIFLIQSVNMIIIISVWEYLIRIDVGLNPT